jgi:hypothetical protein
MNLALRRRIAVGAVATLAATGGALLVLPHAEAAVGAITAVSPAAASNTTTGTTTVVFTTEDPFPPTSTGPTGTRVDLTRVGDSSDKITSSSATYDPATSQVTATFTFGPSNAGGPADPGRYDATVSAGGSPYSDSCSGCFTIFSANPTVTAVNVPSLPNGVQGSTFRVTGTNFARGSRVEAVFPGTGTVDPNITFTAAPDPADDTKTLPITATSIPRSIAITPAAVVGYRDIRVTNPDATSGVLSNGLRITSIFIDKIELNASGNTGVVRRKITGRGFPTGSTPALVAQSASTATPTATIAGTTIDQPSALTINADFDTTAARPGTYHVRVTAPDGSTSTPECSPTYTIVNTGGNSSALPADTASEFRCSAYVAASPSPSASATRSPSATPTSTISPSSSSRPQGCPGTPVTTRVNTKTINATGLASVTVSGATPNATIELQGYSQNHYGTANFDNDPTPVDRTGKADSNGSVTFNDLRPASNTRVRARQAGCTFGNSDVIEVRAQETLQVTRNGVRTYTFSGRSIPARPGGLIVSLYRIVGSACAAGVEPSTCPGEKFVGQARAVALGLPGEGLYSIGVTFPRADQNVRDEFVVKTGRDAQNAPGRSNARSLLIY